MGSRIYYTYVFLFFDLWDIIRTHVFKPPEALLRTNILGSSISLGLPYLRCKGLGRPEPEIVLAGPHSPPDSDTQAGYTDAECCAGYESPQQPPWLASNSITVPGSGIHHGNVRGTTPQGRFAMGCLAM